jgi:hypothetical protein
MLKELRSMQRRLRMSETKVARLKDELAYERQRNARREAYLVRDKEMALERARAAEEAGQYWHGVAIARPAA